MSDNYETNAGTGGKTFRSWQDVAGVDWPGAIMAYLVSEGSPDVLQAVSAATPLPVTGPLTDTQLRAAAVPVSLASVPSHAVTNAGTFAVQVTSAPTTTIQDGGGSITVDGSVSITGSVAVTGTFWQATQPVSLASVPSHAVTGPLTDTELRATAVPVSLATVPSHAVTNAGTFAVQVDGAALTSLQLIDDWDDGADRCKTIQAQDVALDGTTVATVKRFHVVTSTDGATVIAGVANKKFRLRSLSIFGTSGTVTNFWLEDADGTDVFGDSAGIPIDVDGGSGAAGFVLPYNPDGWFQTAAANKNLVIKLTAAQKVVVVGTYLEVA